MPDGFRGSASTKSTVRGQLIFEMWPLYLFLAVMNATVYTTNSQAPFLMADRGVTTAAMRAHLQSINQIMIVTAAFAYPVTRSLLGTRWIPAFFLTMAASGLVLLGLSQNLTELVLARLLQGLGGAM